jgi:hypothetical protein
MTHKLEVHWVFECDGLVDPRLDAFVLFRGRQHLLDPDRYLDESSFCVRDETANEVILQARFGDVAEE